MLLFFGTCLFIQILRTYTFAIRNSHNIMIRDTMHYKININIVDQDYEMINDTEIKDLHTSNENIFNKRNKFSRLKKHSNLRKEPMPNADLSSLNDRLYKEEKNTIFIPISPFIFPITPHSISKRKTNNNEWLSSYYEEFMNKSKPENILHAPKIDKEVRIKESLQEIKDINVKVLTCLLSGFTNKTKATDKQEKLMWKIVKISCCCYVVIAIPLWCTKGWCCCCLSCKFLKATTTIEEAKAYLVTNPPGILKSNMGETRYEPTQLEKYYYEEFEHLLKTI